MVPRCRFCEIAAKCGTQRETCGIFCGCCVKGKKEQILPVKKDVIRLQCEVVKKELGSGKKNVNIPRYATSPLITSP